MQQGTITLQEGSTLPELFLERVWRTPNKVAYREYDPVSGHWRTSTWQQIAHEVARWQAGFANDELQPGDRVAIMLPNCRQWPVFDLAAAGLGLVSVPLYFNDRADNVAYIINDASVKLLLVNDLKQWEAIATCHDQLTSLQRVICFQPSGDEEQNRDVRLLSLGNWLSGLEGDLQTTKSLPEGLTTIVYTSGTTGRPKGVMLSHKNILSNASAALQCAAVDGQDVFLSFLPLSHTLERTIGYYLPMMLGAEVAFARSIPQLAEDLMAIRPTVLVSVPRIYERIYGRIQDGLQEKSPLARKLFALAITIGWNRFEYLQGRAPWFPGLVLWPLLNHLIADKVMQKLGGRLRVAICGGAALSPEVARLFIAFGMPLVQGYGLTEASPVISVNRIEDNIPASIGTPLPGVEVRIGEAQELQTRSDCVMLGYWNNEQATRDVMTPDGWLRTGDQVKVDERGHLYITGRLKDIIVLANGEKLPPTDMEMAIALDGLFEQVMVIGEAKPYLCALVVLNSQHWAKLAAILGMEANDPDALRNKKVKEVVLSRIAATLKAFPGYGQVRRVALYLEPWTVENGLLTPTLKLKRNAVLTRFADDIAHMYEGHGL